MKIILLNVLLMVLLRLNTDGIAEIAPGCEDCGCCVDGACATTGGVDKFCTHGCKAGYRGHRCRNKCPDDCSPCGQWTLIDDSCTTCGIGQFPIEFSCLDCTDNCNRCVGPKGCITCKQSFYGWNCTRQCPTECKTCTSAKKCQECHPPYLNEGEITNCSLTCRQNCICQTPGVCGSCKDGYYNTNDECRGKCPENCHTCSSPKNCHSCKDGFYNGRQESPLEEITDCSLTCRDTCTSCTSHNVCTMCKMGYYGTFCQFKCSVGCLHGECDKVDGSCACIDNFSGGQCAECIPGRHGIQCEKQCPTTCPNAAQGVTCNKLDGTCLRCDFGFYGDICNKACNARCLNNRCSQDNGRCTDGCIDDYQGPFCFPAQAETTSIVGFAVGISSAITFICVAVMVVFSCTVIRKWKRKLNMLTQASYVNTQLQDVSTQPQDNEQPQHDYEDVQTGHQAQDKEYDTI